VNKKIEIPPKTTSATIDVQGMPGEAGDLHVINRFKDGDPRNDLPFIGSPGSYQVTFVLNRPGYNLLPEGQYSFATGLEGDSHLAVTPPAFTTPANKDADRILIVGVTEDGTFTFTGYPNKRGFLGKLITNPFAANDRQDAKRKAYRALASSLSNWSVHLDIPIEIHQVDTLELATGNTQMSQTNPYAEAPLAVMSTAQMMPGFRGYAGLYREALSSSSSVYRFLCLFKIIEGLRARRVRLEREAKKTGATISSVIELLPTDSNAVKIWLDAIFPGQRKWNDMAIDSAVPPEVRGKDCASVIENILNPIRVNVAHALVSPTGELALSTDELLHTQEVNKWLALTKCIARRMLKNDFPAEFLSYLKEDGTIVAGT
jgi:hypothetical protein